MNKVFLSGRLTKDPEMKQSGSYDICRTSIAVDRRMKKNEVDFFNLVAFGKTAEFLSKWFHKGSKLLIEGHLHFSLYEKEGKKLSSVSVVVDSLEFADSKKKAADNSDDGFDGVPVDPDDTPF